MTILEFTSSVIDSLAWPLVVLIIAFILRKPIIKVFSKLNKLTYNNLEMDFSQKLESIENQMEAQEMSVGVMQTVDPDKIKRRNILTVAKISPAAAIPISWSMVEQEILSTIKRLSISDFPSSSSSSKNINLLADANLIDNETRKAFDELQKLRNEIVPSNPITDNITYSDAEKYYRLSIRLIHILKSLQRQNSNL
ncbi:hypothetical protein [Oceanobacillus massiliensis]|uniref:hypothetical protein n=1 Tax=Oceanobacillus massiliensis TaxID=1465765 RepID=UPI0002897A53|nr:hypothetical protein [Oceanobacillus massiliensis]